MNNLTMVILSLICFIPAVICHEVAHGYVANLLGDPTAKAMGRLTLNPLKHIDPFGSIILPLLLALMNAPIFGYAKPVPYNPENFVKSMPQPVTPEAALKRLKRGELLVGLAGPATNFLLALLGAGIYWLGVLISASSASVGSVVVLFGYLFIVVNLVLMFFNLIPLPPLDGSSIIAVFLSPKAMQSYYKIQRYALPLLLVVIFVVPWFLSMVGISFDPLSWYFDHTAYALARVFTGGFFG